MIPVTDSLVERKLPTLPEHLSSPMVFSGVRVTRSLVVYVCSVDRYLPFCTFSFAHCDVCYSSIYGLWLPLWYLSRWVSEWLLFNANAAILQLYHGEKKLLFDEMMLRSALYLTSTLSWIFIVLAHWNNSPWVDMSLHSGTLFMFRANQSLLFLLSDSYLGEKQQVPIV